mgnify:FL=1
MKKVAIIGAGAAGVICGIHAVCSDIQVVLFDKNIMALKKLLATGNGRCNYWNSNQDLCHYHSSEEELLPSIITPEIQREVLDFFDSLGVVPSIRNGYYYPYSNQASSIRDLLEVEARRRGVIFSLGSEVVDVYRESDKFVIVYDDKKEYFDDLVIATGSLASFKKSGEGESGYLFAEKFGLDVSIVHPALVALKTSGDFLKDWAGVRATCVVSLYQDGNFVKSEEGEIQLTDYGVSGICIFNLSRYASLEYRYSKMELKISFLPFLKDKSKEYITSWFSKRGEQLGDYSMVSFLEGLLPYKLLMVILSRTHISKSSTWSSLTEEEKDRLLSYILEFPLLITGCRDFSCAQVCAGGVKLSSVNSNLEAKKIPHLYFVGEVLDVDGDCGGYNLGFAWMSGMIVGRSIRGDD